MALKIVQGGTTGAADGTLVDSGHPIVFTGIDVPVDVHIRADDDTYAAPAQFVAATTAGPAVGKGDIQISVDGGSTWKSWSDNPYSIATGVGAGPDLGDLNFPVKLRQHAASPPGDTSGSFDTDGTFASATALGDVSGFTVTPGDAQNALSWSAVSNRTAYRIDRATDSGFTTGVALDISPGQTGTSFTDTGRTNGTTYYYRIKAVGTVRYKDSANYATGNGAPIGTVAGFAASVSGTTVNLSWTAYPGANHYKIERATDSGFTTGLTTVSDSVTGTTLADTGRSANTVYYYRIKAHDASHNALSNFSTCGAGVQILVLASSTRNLRGFNATFATARSGGGTNSVVGTDATQDGADCQEGGGYYLDRQAVDFDTTAIPAGIDQAWLRQTATYVGFAGSSGWTIEKGTYTNDPPVAGDFASIGGTDLGGPTSTPSINTPTDYAISSPATNVIAGGITKFMCRDRVNDYGNSAPGSGVVHGAYIGGKGNATTDYRPQLKVSYHF